MTRVERNRLILALVVSSFLLGLFVIDTPVEFLIYLGGLSVISGVIANVTIRPPARSSHRADRHARV